MICPSPSEVQKKFCYNPITSGTSFGVIGVAGSGKTVSLVNRIKYIRKNSKQETKILVITFNKVLILYLECLLKSSGYPKDAVKVVNFDKLLYDIFNENKVVENKDFKVCNRTLTEKLICEIAKKYGSSTEEEFQILKEVVKIQIDKNVQTENKSTRKVFREYLQLKKTRKLYDFYDLYHWFNRNADTLIRKNKVILYDHLFVDEAQDLTVESIYTIKKFLKPNGTFNLLADYAQEIYEVNPQERSNISCDKTIEFHENYRNNSQIALFLKSITEHKYYIKKERIIDSIVPKAIGANPTYVRFDSEGLSYEVSKEKEMYYAYKQAVSNIDISRYAILVKTWKEIDQLRSAFAKFDHKEGKKRATQYWEVTGDLVNNLKKSKKIDRFDFQNGIYLGTYHSAKGLEFEVVHLLSMGINDMEDNETRLQTFPNEYDKQLKLLYVGCSRAIKRLVISYIDDISPLLPSYNDLRITKVDKKCSEIEV